MNKLWLPRGTELPDQTTVDRLLSGAEEWQIMSTFSKSTALVAKPALLERWVHDGLVSEASFVRMGTPDGPVCVLCGKYGYLMSSMEYGPYPSRAAEAHLFALTLARARKKIDPSVSLHDALYVEQLSLLLPTYTQGAADDRLVLGMWLASGVRVSTDQFDRLCSLLSWLPRSEVVRIVKAAGFETEINRAASAAEPVRKLPPDARFLLPGRPALEDFFNENIVEIIANEEKYRRMGFDFPGAVLLYGPPGCGKTFAVERLMEFLGWPCFVIDSSTIGSTFIHETGMRIASVFDKAVKSAPAAVIIDEMDAFLMERSAGSASNPGRVEEVAEFLRRIPEASKNRVLVFGMTNRLDTIDPAIIRRGRFDHLVEIKMPSAQEVQALLESKFKTLPMAQDANAEALAQKLAGHAMSDVTFVLREAGRLAVRRDLDKIDNAALMDALALLPEEDKTQRRIGF